MQVYGYTDFNVYLDFNIVFPRTHVFELNQITREMRTSNKYAYHWVHTSKSKDRNITARIL